MAEERMSHRDNEFQTRRAGWLEAIAVQMMAGAPWQEAQTAHPNDPPLSHIEKAMLVSHVGLSHIYGLSEEDMAIGPYLPFEVAERTISRWRSGDFDPRLCSQLNLLWLALFQVGRDTCTIRKPILEDVAKSALCNLMRYQTEGNLQPKPDTALSAIAEENYADFSYTAEVSPSNGSYPLNIAHNHLRLLRHILENSEQHILSSVSLLELVACYGDDENERWGAKALEKVRSRKFLPLILSGAWPQKAGDAPPAWVLDMVRTRGARFSYASSGFVPGWFLVMDSADIERAVVRTGYETKFFYGREEGKLILGFVLEFPDDTRAHITYTYHLADTDSLNNLSTMLAIGIVRIDFYKLKPDASLAWSHSIGRQIPHALIKALRTEVMKWTAVDLAGGTGNYWTIEHRMQQMALMERNLFERLVIPQQLLQAEANSSLMPAYSRFLDVAHVVTHQHYAGKMVDTTLYEEAVNDLYRSIALSASSFELVNLDIVGNDTAYIQMYTVDGYLHALVAYNGSKNVKQCKDVDLSDKIRLSAIADDICRTSNELAAALIDLKKLQDEGVNKLVLCAGVDVYNLPFHDALIDLGFERVSYTHRLGTIDTDFNLRTNASAYITGHADPEGTYLAAMKYELSVLQLIYGETCTVAPVAKEMPEIMHWAGHGFHGFTAFEGGMQMGPSNTDFVSSASILADYDCSSTYLVYLSACSTGRGEYGSNSLPMAIPMDVAFIEAGARAVLSTTAPVNDVVSAFFAIVFHFALVGKQLPVWDSYELARLCTRSQALTSTVNELGIILDAQWPSWRTDLNLATCRAPDDWRLFRLSGRFWP
ncbi:CHAT domain-containing protein [Arthrobacter sp. NPDC058097]|uniref:CHAT domain-containing protein n=1 Tax=Arthrobacter sp. NPDC058097 TaxID=3346340 RepID=UPI0036DC01AC